MKKSILLILALAGAVSADDVYTLHSSIISSDGTMTDAWKALDNKTYYTQIAVPGVATSAHLAFNTPITFTLSLSQMIPSAADLENTRLNLSSFSFLARNDGQYVNYGALSITVNGQTATSDTFTIATPQTNGSPAVTYTFDSGLTLTTSDTITVTLSSGNAAQTGFGMQAFQPDTGNGYSFGGAPELHEGYSTVYSVGLSLLPEPTTATLSVLALAGLAARRRHR